MGYKTVTPGTKRLERDLRSEPLLGTLGLGRHTVTLSKIQATTTSVTFDCIDSHGDKLDTRVFIRDFGNPEAINPRMKALLSATAKNSEELMRLADAILDGEFHELAVLNGKRLSVEVGLNGDDLDIIRFGRAAQQRKPLIF